MPSAAFACSAARPLRMTGIMIAKRGRCAGDRHLISACDYLSRVILSEAGIWPAQSKDLPIPAVRGEKGDVFGNDDGTGSAVPTPFPSRHAPPESEDPSAALACSAARWLRMTGIMTASGNEMRVPVE